jgi:hypothetical protein
MDNHPRKPGRPKSSPRTTPLVLDAELNLTKVEVAVPEATAKTLGEYVIWVQRCSDKTAEAADTATVDFALREVFRRDRLWRDERRIPEQRPPVIKPTITPSPLPLPTGSSKNPRSVS